MRLRKFRVRAYRCIHDSGEITVGDLAAFVGRNESGKTTILQALTLLNKDEKISDLDLCDELSEELKGEVTLAEGEFELNSNEIRLVKEAFPGLPDIRKIKLFRTNKVHRVQYEFEDIQISNERNSEINSWENFSKIYTDLDIFYSFYKNKSITITGTNGKSTTSKILHEVLLDQNYDCRLIGNIGNPALSEKKITKNIIDSMAILIDKKLDLFSSTVNNK